ncbi:hypothetical protein FPV67DRAFT_1671117 [Lyophyllum atratum]|nr:hypothetical protein FPV67DRAFT_1671117 [Lyophyllum atratum]
MNPYPTTYTLLAPSSHIQTTEIAECDGEAQWEMHRAEGLPATVDSVAPMATPQPSRPHPVKRKGRLACFFCRGRKIACGPDSPGSDTCRQCAQRTQQCIYPVENRRQGMHKTMGEGDDKEALVTSFQRLDV